jgi:hypothetical protein
LRTHGTPEGGRTKRLAPAIGAARQQVAEHGEPTDRSQHLQRVTPIQILPVALRALPGEGGSSLCHKSILLPKKPHPAIRKIEKRPKKPTHCPDRSSTCVLALQDFARS